jgi:predicted ATPase/DNA-binding CsgD family transcriptional regulator
MTDTAAMSLLVPGSGSWPASLPIPLTPFVGRENELAQVIRLVAANRLVTLTGAGGVGKTRLAVEVAAAISADFGDGTVLIDLSPITDQSLLPGAVARGLGVEERGGTDVGQRLTRVLRGQHKLLVLDNCEHLRVASADLAAGLLGSCPGVVILATSRERLGVPGEVTWRVPSLSFPWPERAPAAQETDSYEAVVLFLARARAARPGLRVGADDIAAVTSICFRLDGIPLALELAAARAGALSLTEIANRLTGRFGLLTGSATGPARHQTLRASVEWSYQLLQGQERALFRRLAVFADGWALDAAEEVCGAPPLAGDEVAALLAALVDKSLVNAEQTPTGSRYRLLEVIRAYAREQLESCGELDQTCARQAGYYAELAERSAPMLLGPGQATCAHRLDRESENLRAAGRWCGADPARTATGLRLASGLWEYWHIRGRLAEGTAWLEKALAAGGPEHARAAAMNGLGVLVSLQGEPKRGQDLFAASIERYREAGDRHGEARAWSHLGNARTLCGDAPGAAEAFRRGLALSRSLEDPWLEAFALFLSGLSATLSGDVGGETSRITAATPLFERAGDRRGTGYTLLALGDCLIQQQRAEEALAPLREGVAIFEALPERWGLMYGAWLLAEASGALGDWPRAALLLGILDTLGERTGGQLFPHQQATLQRLVVRAAEHLGPALPAARQAGQVLGRSDQITAALWLAPGREEEPDRALPLTRREREIAELITDGLTNRQIAARLVIAERTVDTHVGRILAKLACSSRAQVAALVTAAAMDPAAQRPGDPRTPTRLPTPGAR